MRLSLISNKLIFGKCLVRSNTDGLERLLHLHCPWYEWIYAAANDSCENFRISEEESIRLDF